MKILQLILLFSFLSCTKTIVVSDPTDASSRLSVIEVESFGAKGDGIHDDTAAFMAAIKAIPKRAKLNSAKKGYWGIYKAGLIKLRPNSQYKITRPIVIPTNKNVTIISEALGGAAIVFEGKKNEFVFDFLFKGINASIKIEGIQFFKGGIRLQGSTRGRIIIRNNQFVETTGPAISIVDAKDIGTHKSSYGVCHWLIDYNDFNYCQEGIHIDSESILLGTIEKCRFNLIKGTPIFIDGGGILINDCEFQCVYDLSKPYIHLLPKNNSISNIRIKESRFGSEQAEFGGKMFYPPEVYVIVGDGKRSGNIIIEDNFFFTTKTTKNARSSLHAIKIENRLIGLAVEGNVFRGIKKELVVNKAAIKDGFFIGNTIGEKSVIFSGNKKDFKVENTKTINN